MRLHITIELENSAFDAEHRDVETARILHKLANRIGDAFVGVEGVNCDTLLDVNGNSVGEVWLASDDDADARYLRDMAAHMRMFEAEADPDNFDDAAENAAGELSMAVGHYLAAIGHPEAPDFAKRRLRRLRGEK